jgi:hypothetical protein
MRLHYTVDGMPQDYRVRIEATRCHYGGLRWWFVCPLTGRRAAKLYLPNEATTFAARGKYRLAYRSQRQTLRYRQLEAVRRFRRKLSASEDLFETHIERPKGMWRRTFTRLLMHADEARDAAVGGLQVFIEAHDRKTDAPRQESW